jgi:hypothetical protein
MMGELHWFLTFTLDWVSSQILHPAALSLGEERQVSTNRKLGGTECQSGYFKEEKNILLMPGTEPLFLKHP